MQEDRGPKGSSNVENENVEPVTDLGLALGYSGHMIERRSSNDLGAGANAASRIDMTFVAADTLSEIVWSPHKGLGLKRTECSFSDNKHSLVQGAEPSNAVCLPQQINTSARSSNEKPLDEQNIYKSSSTFPDLNTKISDIDNLDKSAGDNDKIRLCHEPQTDNDNSFQGTSAFVNLVEKNDPRDSENNQVAEIAKPIENNIPSSPDGRKPDVAQIESLFDDPANEVGDVDNGTRLSLMEMFLASEVHTDNECDAVGPPEKNVTSQAENDLQGLGDDEYVATSKISGSESAFEAEKNSQHHKGIRSEKMSADKHSLTNSRIRRYRRKGKEKALFDGDVKGMMSKAEDDESHDSVESCNSAALFSTGKKRWGFEQQLIVGSKRVKKQIDENPCSPSFVKQDSSFTNWILNMMKGFPKSKDETLSLALTTAANMNQSHESPIENLDTSDKNQDPGRRNIGFQSIFHSVCSSKTKVQGTPQSENDQTGLELTNKISDIDATLIACHGENFNFLNVFNERFKEPICGSRVGPPTRPKILLMTLSPSKRSSEGNIAENTNSCNLPVDVEKDRASTSSSLGKCKMNIENIDSDPPSQAKTVHNIGYKSNLLESLWITRFTHKSSSSLLNGDTVGSIECLSDCMKLTPCFGNNVNVSNNLNTVETRQQCAEESVISLSKELPCATEMEASIGLRSLRLKDSEAMASLFTTRLDTLKHIVPYGVSDNRTSSTVTCFFCGRKGHHLQYCPEITDNEIEHLPRNMKSSNRFEKLPCVCVRCFELDHWAVTCPTTSIGQRHSACGASSLASFSELQCYARFEENTKLLDDNREVTAGWTLQIDTRKGPSTLYEVTADKMRSNTNVNKKYVSSSSQEIKPWGNFINQRVWDTPKAIFDAVRMLRLSRTDILKWKNSQTSVSHLEGFFLRLRLAKWEEGSGGTGYYVACITEANRQNAQRNSKKFIAVNVGGIECLVESQYISNHDFLEDELTAWLQATTRSGGKIPLEEELTMKVTERRMLGF